MTEQFIDFLTRSTSQQTEPNAIRQLCTKRRQLYQEAEQQQKSHFLNYYHFYALFCCKNTPNNSFRTKINHYFYGQSVYFYVTLQTNQTNVT